MFVTNLTKTEKITTAKPCIFVQNGLQFDEGKPCPFAQNGLKFDDNIKRG
jgi:hypothetical protein